MSWRTREEEEEEDKSLLFLCPVLCTVQYTAHTHAPYIFLELCVCVCVCVWVYSTELLLLLKEVKKKKSFGCVPEVTPCSHIVVHFCAEVTTAVWGGETESGSSTYCVMDNRRGRTGQGRAAHFVSPSSSNRITSNIAHEICIKSWNCL